MSDAIDLRDRVAEALRTRVEHGPLRPLPDGPGAVLYATMEDLADAVMPIVNDAIRGRLRGEIERADLAEHRLFQVEGAARRETTRADDAEGTRDRCRERAEQAEAAIDRVRALHRPMPVYAGDERCLADVECFDGQDYPADEESAIGGFCPHTIKAATLCPACSRMDLDSETWPKTGWVLHENCATIAALKQPEEAT